MFDEFSVIQKRWLTTLTIIALGFGAYFLRNYLELLAIGAVLAYLFNPAYQRLRARTNAGVAAAGTFVLATVVVLVPVAGIAALAVMQIGEMVAGIGRWMQNTDLSDLAERWLATANDALAQVPFLHITLTEDSIRSALTNVGQNAGQMVLSGARESVGGAASAIAAGIIFLYVFLGLLTSGDKVLDLFRDLNPLGPQVSEIYLDKVGAMVTATVRGQFIIAACQGVAASASLYIAGLHQGFFMFVIFLTALSFIPLGAGIVTIPIGIVMALFGNVGGGIFVVVFHLLVVTNIDNVLRPFLVPKSAHLHPALMLLSVFAGLQMFGFWGIVLGPVLMIIIVTTISVYRTVYRGADFDDEPAPPPRHRLRRREAAAGGGAAATLDTEDGEDPVDELADGADDVPAPVGAPDDAEPTESG